MSLYGISKLIVEKRKKSVARLKFLTYAKSAWRPYRLYVELKQEMREGTSREDLSQEFVMKTAEEIFEV